VVTALAVLIRPNLAPLAIVVAALVVTAPAAPIRLRAHATLIYLGVAAIGPGPLLWSQAALYGHPLASGYPGAADFFGRGFIARNAVIYARLFRDTHTWLPVLGLLLPIGFAAAGRTPRSWRLVAALVAVVVVNIAVHLPYQPYDSWQFLRFLLPATTALFVLYAAVISHLSQAAPRRSVVVAALVSLLVAPVMWQGRHDLRLALELWRDQGRVRLMGHYLAAMLPRDAVILAYFHSGAMAHYTGREVVRLDLIDPTRLDATIASLTNMGRTPVVVVDEAIERAAFSRRFSSSRLAALDWPPRASAVSVTAIHLFDPADVAGRARGETWPTDIVR
jgi:hypothetical protein